MTGQLAGEITDTNLLSPLVLPKQKTNTMKKIHTVSLISLTVLINFYSETHAQTSASVQKKIELANAQFIKWFNSGQADSIVTQYHTNACITGRGCGKEFLQRYYKGETGTYAFKELTTLSVTVNGKNATETGHWRIQLANGAELSGEYNTEWQQVNNRWVIFKETVLE